MARTTSKDVYISDEEELFDDKVIPEKTEDLGSSAISTVNLDEEIDKFKEIIWKTLVTLDKLIHKFFPKTVEEEADEGKLLKKRLGAKATTEGRPGTDGDPLQE